MSEQNNRILSPLLRLREEQFRLITVCMLIVASLALCTMMFFAKSVLIPFVLAIFISILVSPVQNHLVLRCRCPRWVGVIVSLLVVFIVVMLIVTMLTISVQSVITGAQNYSNEFIKSIDQIAGWIDPLLAPLGLKADFQTIKVGLRTWMKTIGPQTFSMFQSLMSTMLLLTIFLFFLLLGRDPRRNTQGFFAQVEAHTRKYIFIKTIISIITGIGAWLILRYLGCPMAEMIGVATFVLNYIPSIGSIIATFLPIPLIMAQYGDQPIKILYVVLLLGILQNLMGNLIEPKIQGEGLKLHPVAILLSLAVCGLLWGVIGMFLAAPIAAATRVLLDQFETTRPFADLMGGMPFDEAVAVKSDSMPVGASENAPAGKTISE